MFLEQLKRSGKEAEDVLEAYNACCLRLSGNSSSLAPWYTTLGWLQHTPVATLDSRIALQTRGGTQPLVLDLSGLSHLASSGVALLLDARRTTRAHGQELTLLARPGR